MLYWSNSFSRHAGLGFSLLCLLALQGCGGLKTHAADTVLTGGAVYTLDSERPWAAAIAVKNGENSIRSMGF